MIWSIQLAAVGSADTPTQTLDVATRQSGWTLISEQQTGQVFYRTKLNGTLKLEGTEYTWLLNQRDRINCCAEIDIRWFTPACDNSQEDLFWHGYFKMDAVKWDHANCIAEISQTNPRDLYDALFKVWTKPINMIGTPVNFPFYARYADYYSWQPRAKDGQMESVLPDGNKPGDGLNRHKYPKGFRIIDVLTHVLRESVMGSRADAMRMLGCLSEFYTADVNPVHKRANNIKLLVAGSDAKRPASLQPATKLDITLKELLDELRALHNVWWHIDPITKALVVEHLSFYPARSYTSAAAVSFNLNRWPDSLQQYDNESVDLDSLYGEEELIIANNAQSDYFDFKKGNVTYNETCIVLNDDGTPKKNTLTAQRIYTDLLAGYRYPDSIPDSAILLVEVAYQGQTFPEVVTSAIFDVNAIINIGVPNLITPDLNILNSPQTAARLFMDFHLHGRSFHAGLVNRIPMNDGSYTEGVQMTMASVKSARKQEGIVITLCCEDFPLNLSGYIVGKRFQKGELAKAVFDPEKDTMALDVWAESLCNATVVTMPAPKTGCPAGGVFLRGESEEETCENGKLLSKRFYGIFTDGACGEMRWLLYTVGPYQC